MNWEKLGHTYVCERRECTMYITSGVIRAIDNWAKDDGTTFFIIRLTHANVWESMGKLCSCTQFIKSHIFYYKSCENPCQVLQVTREFVSGNASHMRIRIRYYKSRKNPYQVQQVTCGASECAMKSKVRMINHYHYSTKLYWKKYHSFVAISIVPRAVHS